MNVNKYFIFIFLFYLILTSIIPLANIIKIQPLVKNNYNTINYNSIIDTHNFNNLTIDNLLLEFNSSNSQEIVFSNNNATHFTMETDKLETRKWQGLVDNDINYITNVWPYEGSSKTTSEISRTIVSPIDVKIEYDTVANETIFVPDELAGLFYQFKSKNPNIAIEPTFALRIDYYSSSSINDYSITSDPDGVVFLKTQASKYIAIVVDNGSFQQSPRLLNREFPKDDLRSDGSSTENVFSPGTFTSSTNSIKLAVGIGTTKTEAKSIANKIILNIDNLKKQKRNRIENLINDNLFYAEIINNKTPINLNFTRTYALLLISLDKLKMKRFGDGLYAGLHWFDDYWGRDTFISFKGSLLTIGQWNFAKETLSTMAQLQLNNSNSLQYGRVPNRVTSSNNSPDYSTADGTGWFVKAIRDYISYSNDLDFAKQMIRHVELAVNGEISRLDNLGFVTHQDRETWMDAQTGNLIQTPRGNRAVEIQALLYQMYQTLIFLYKLTKTKLDKIEMLEKTSLNLVNNIREYYYAPLFKLIYDHLQVDNTPSLQKRPNQFIALSLLPDNFIGRDALNKIISNNLDIITQFGIRTLSPKDPNYKKTHDGGNYHHDAAYHNGDIWPWLSGPVIDVLLNSDYKELVSDLISTLVINTLVKNPVGGIGEIFDGDTTNWGESVGAVFQLWSMAEFVRILDHSFSGFEVDLLNNQLVFSPKLFDIFKNYGTILKFGNSKIRFQYENNTDFKINLTDIPEMNLVINIPKIKSNQQIIITPSINYKILQNDVYTSINIDKTTINKITIEVVESKKTNDTSIESNTISQNTNSDIKTGSKVKKTIFYYYYGLLILLPLLVRKRKYIS